MTMSSTSARDAPESPAARLALIRECLGEPAFERGSVLLYEGDCVTLMEKTPPGVFDLAVTSPPYNIGKEYERRLPLAEYLSWSEAWISAVFRLTRPTGAFWLNLGYVSVRHIGKAVPLPYLLWNRVPFFLVQEIVWNYGAGVAARQSFSPRNEKFLWYVKDPSAYTFNLDAVRDPSVKYPNQKKNGKIKVNPLGKNPSDVWTVPKVTSGAGRSSKERTGHPAQFPVALVDRIIDACSDREAIVFDPFMGSGSVAEAAIRRGRQVVGFEIESRYLAMAARRVDRILDAGTQRLLFGHTSGEELD